MTKEFGSPTTMTPPVFADEASNILYKKNQSMINDFPELPFGSRIFVRLREIETSYEKVESNIIGGPVSYKGKNTGVHISEEQFAKILKEQQLKPQLVDVIAVGAEVKDVKPGDIIRVYLNQCEANPSVQGEDYLVFSERTIISKVK